MPFSPPCNGRSARLQRRRARAALPALIPASLLAMVLAPLAGAPGRAASPPSGSGSVGLRAATGSAEGAHTASPFALLPETAALGGDDRARLAAGEVLVRFAERRGRGPREGIGIGVIDYPPERVFRALADWGHWEEFMPFLERSDAAPQPDGSVVVAQLLSLPAPLGDREFQVRGSTRVDGQGEGRVWRASWAHVPGTGNIAAHHGAWALVRLAPGRTLAVCRLRTDPGDGPDWAADRATSKSLPWIFKGLRLQARRSRYDAL